VDVCGATGFRRRLSDEEDGLGTSRKKDVEEENEEEGKEEEEEDEVTHDAEQN
jgi:hypothetical protein